MTEQLKYSILVVVTVLVSAAMFVLFGPIAQPVEYHNFADARGWLGIPNFGDVVSNLPFTLFGLYGMWVLARGERTGDWAQDARLPLMVFFIAIVFVGPGSAYYHLEPNHETLFWDRVPIVAGFMALTAAVISDRISPSFGTRVALPVLVVLGVGLALHWKLTDDLRAYMLVQIIPVLIIPLILWMWPTASSQSQPWITWHMIVWSMVWYGLAKVTEFSDVSLFHALGETLSGHTIKHLLAAGVPLAVALGLARRETH